MRAMVALVLRLGGVGECVRLIWEWMDRLCKGLSIPRNQGIHTPLRQHSKCGEIMFSGFSKKEK